MVSLRTMVLSDDAKAQLEASSRRTARFWDFGELELPCAPSIFGQVEVVGIWNLVPCSSRLAMAKEEHVQKKLSPKSAYLPRHVGPMEPPARFLPLVHAPLPPAPPVLQSFPLLSLWLLHS